MNAQSRRLGGSVCASPAERIDALVCGLPHAKRDSRWMLMLVSYFDDSGSDANNSPVYVLGGFVSTVDKWRSFSDEWQAALDRAPRLNYFKMREAKWLRGQFEKGWCASLRDQRVYEMAEIARKHAMARIDCALLRSHFDQTLKGIAPGPTFNNPYFICFYHIISLCIELQMDLDVCDDCDFIFDCHGEIGSHAVGWWDIAKELAGHDLERFMGNPPTFRSDLGFLPLQAADLYAWQTQNFLRQGLYGEPFENEVAKVLAPIRHMSHAVSPTELIAIRHRALAIRDKMFGF